MRIMSQSGERVVTGPYLTVYYRAVISEEKVKEVPEYHKPRYIHSGKVNRTVLLQEKGEAICDFEIYVNDKYFGTLNTRAGADTFMNLVMETDPDARLKVPPYQKEA